MIAVGAAPPPSELEPLRLAAAGEVSERLLGCCANASDAGVACERFTDSARAFHCGGCAAALEAER